MFKKGLGQGLGIGLGVTAVGALVTGATILVVKHKTKKAMKEVANAFTEGIASAASDMANTNLNKE